MLMSLAYAQEEMETISVDSFEIEPFQNLDEKKERFIDYFYLMPKAVRDYTPSNFFEKFKDVEINSIEVFIVDRFDDPVYAQEDIKNAVIVGNKRSKQSAVLIKKQLLFDTGDKVDPMLIADTERNIRENTVYKDAVIIIEPSPHISGVDVKVYVHDNRHWKAIFGGTPRSLTLGGSFLDFFGVSQRFDFYGTGLIDPRNPYNIGVNYNVKNIARSQIGLTLDYNKQNLSERYGFTLKRKFFAYNTKWAGKLQFSNNARKIETNEISNDYNNRYLNADVWLGRSYGLKNLNQKHPNLRMIFSVRGVINNHYVIPKNQPFQNFVNKQIYLGSIGLANRDWYGFEELYKFRQFDYVPKGFNLAYIGGYELNGILGGRFYNGFTVNYNKQYPKFGFLQNEFKIGSFLREKSLEQITFQSKISYFTNRASIGKLGFRQFISSNTTLSFNRPISEFYNIGNSAIRGFDSQRLIGTKSFVLNIESVFYTPIDWWTSTGNFFFFADLGVLGRSNRDFLFNNTIYQGYGGGIRFQNLILGIAYMEISLGYYPNGYLVNERDFGYQIGATPPRQISTNNSFNPGILNDIY